MAILCARYPQAVCILAGEGAERSALEAQVARHGLQANVLLAGFYSDALSLINAADLFVLPSSVESFGLVQLEAMALGKPVVATQVGGPAEVVQDGATGFLVPPRDANALADAIEKVLSDRSLAGQFGQAGRARYEQHFQPQRMAEETLAVYRAALCKGGAA